ncbi:MAG: UPF0175 family protein [Candidatus Helarchaeota archaeon]
MKNIASRIHKELEADIEEFMKERGLDKSSAIRIILQIGIAEWKKNRAIELYKIKRITLWKASQMAGLSLREIIEELNRRKIPINVTTQEIIEDIKAASEAES